MKHTPPSRRSRNRPLPGAEPRTHGTPAEIRAIEYVRRFDDLARHLDRKWGRDRVNAKCSPETATKFAEGMEQFNEALTHLIERPDETAQWAAHMTKGLEKMDAEAEALGAPQADARYVEVEMNELTYAVCFEDHDARAVKAECKDLPVVSLQELCAAYEWMVQRVLEGDGNEQIQERARKKPVKVHDDDLNEIFGAAP